MVTKKMNDNDNENEPLSPGDIIELGFKTIGGTWLKAAQIMMIERQLKGRKDFEIISTDYWTKDKVIFKIRIKDVPFELSTGQKIAKLISSFSPLAFVFFHYKKIYAVAKKIPETVEAIAKTTTNIGKIALIGFLIISGLYIVTKAKLLVE